MAALKEKSLTILGTATVDLHVAAATTLFTVPPGKTARVTHVMVRDTGASLAGCTSVSFTTWRQTADLSNMTTSGTTYMILDGSATNSLLASKTGVDMKTAASTTLYTTPASTITRLSHILIKDYTASLANGTSYTVTGLRAAFSLTAMTTANTGCVIVKAADLVEQTEIAASTNVVFTVTTGATAAGTATIEVYGYQEPPDIYTELAAGTNFQITVNTIATANPANATFDIFGYLT